MPAVRVPSVVAKNQAPGALTENGEPGWRTPNSTERDPRSPTMPHTSSETGRRVRPVASGPKGAAAGLTSPVGVETAARSEGFDTPSTVLSRPGDPDARRAIGGFLRTGHGCQPFMII